ncbi:MULTISPECIES: hypothetical protein [Bacillota]|uniref:hypothetical protein n=1 Tax=Bacillota TaxID=1239 RepID=UPI0039EF26FE
MTDKKLDMILTALSEFRSGFYKFKNESQEQSEENKKRFKEIKGQLERIEETTLRLEAEQPKDITTILNQISKKLDERDNDLQALNKRVFRTESEIERLARQ